jgi:tRNA (guanine-N7-)-methyltransferase
MQENDETAANRLYLDAIGALVDETSDDDDTTKEDIGTASVLVDEQETSTEQHVYTARKPKWYKNISGTATKAQKRAMREILEGHRLPRVPYGSFLDWEEIYPQSKEVWLEVGFGRGENLLALASRKPSDVLLVGAEIHQPGVGTACQRMLEGILNKAFWTEYVTYAPELDPYHDGSATAASHSHSDSHLRVLDSQGPYNNVRLYPGDGVKLFPYIPSSSLSVVLLTFPDPFEKNSQKKWRLLQIHTVVEIHRILKTSGYFYLATDHEGYHEWSHSVMNQLNSDETLKFRIVDPCPDRLDWLPVISRYEQKGWDEGRSTRLSCWQALPEASLDT